MSDLVFPSLPGVYIVNRTPFFETAIGAANTGAEARTALRTVGYRYSLRIAGLRPSLGEHRTLCDFFIARQGRADSFIFTDTWDGSPGVERRVRFDDDELDLEVSGGIWTGSISLVTVPA